MEPFPIHKRIAPFKRNALFQVFNVNEQQDLLQITAHDRTEENVWQATLSLEDIR